MTAAHVDFETRSAVDIEKTGAIVYAQDATTDVWCMAYAFDDEPVELWTPPDLLPRRLREHIESGGALVAHNASFERAIWKYVMAPRYGWPEPTVDQWRCTMGMAYAMALPGALEHVGPALNTGFAKDMAGHRLMLAMARPLPGGMNAIRKKEWQVLCGMAAKARREGDIMRAEDLSSDADRFRRRFEDDVLFRAWDDRLGEYCKADVEAERAADKRLVRLRPSEQRLWALDQTINDRGVPVDANLCRRARAIVEAQEAMLDRKMKEATDFRVTACSNVGQLKTFLTEHKVDTEALDREAIVELLLTDLPDPVRAALLLRQEASKASVKKIGALLNGMSPDGRARGLLQFHAASTGRWAGRRFQPQNIVRPEEGADIDGVIETILEHPTAVALKMLDAFHGPPLTCVGYSLRGMIAAPKGKKIVAADYTSIEGVVLPWLAGEQDKLDAFKRYIAGKGPNLYLVSASRIFNKPAESLTKKSPEYMPGKIADLACGFGGGVGAFQAMAHGYGFKISDDEANEIKKGWRAAHPNIVNFWDDLDEAAIQAVHRKGKTIACGKVAFRVVGSFLWCRLPSGRALCYPYPKVLNLKTPWNEYKDTLTFKAVPNVSNKKKIVKEDESNTPKWSRISTYGGSLAENVTQAVARDVLAEAMFRLEDNGYPLILTVHDENVSEVDEGFGSASEYEEIMAEPPAWAGGLPIAASGFEGDRYKKG